MLKKTRIALLVAAGITTSAPIMANNNVTTNDYWWPDRINLSELRHSNQSANPLDPDFNYAEAFASLDLEQVKADLSELMRDSQDWWPADYGHYGPFFIRMAWHSAGTYRATDGRGGADGGQQRFAPLINWPDNVSLDKAQRLLLPVKQKYGNAISWSDLIVLAGTIAMEDMGFEILGFAGGREDDWQPVHVNWGAEKEWLTENDDRFGKDRSLQGPFAATEMGLIYVNPEGPHGDPDPIAAAHDIRQAFARMGMDDEETAALIAGGHTFGKAHGAHNPSECVGDDPEDAGLEQQGLGWKNTCGTGVGADTVTSGLEGAWTVSPAEWTHNYLQNLYGWDWELTTSPAGAKQWVPTNGQAANLVPDAHTPNLRHAPIMFTTDLSLREDPAFREITENWLYNSEEFEKAFARAWFKLTHRDMGPTSRYIGSLVPDEEFIWQDPIPVFEHDLINDRDISRIKSSILDSGLSVPQLVRVAWGSASTFRNTDNRGGANGARIALVPQNGWDVNQPEELAHVLSVLEGIQQDFNNRRGKRKVSLADVIVLAGNAAIEKAAAEAGHKIEVPFTPGRGDATQELTDIDSINLLEPKADGFRNYFSEQSPLAPAEALVDRAATLGLNVPEMTALVGGMRALNANSDGSEHGVFTNRPGQLTNDFFVNLVDMSTVWAKSESSEGLYEGRDRASGDLLWTATPVDLILGANTELRAVSQFYAQSDSEQKFINDFVNAWVKVMNADRFDVK